MSESWSARFLRARFAEFGQDVPPAPHTPTPAAWNDNAITLAWLGHATVLVNFYGLRLITDPVLFNRIGVDLGIGSLGPQRLVRCALAPDALPEIDLVLVSHAHFDHLDTPSLAAIARPAGGGDGGGDRPTCCRGAATPAVHELRWNESVTVDDAARRSCMVRAIEVKHWGARIRRDTHRGYNGWVLEREGPAAADRRRHRQHRRCSATIAASGRSRRR